MYYTGIDLHRKSSFVTTINERENIIKKRNIINNEADILEYFLNLDADTKVVIESTSSWYWIYDLLTEHGLSVVISNPVKTKAIASAKIKNDKLDSHMLAQLLRSDMIACVHASSSRCRQLKELLRHRAKLVRDCVRHKNRIQNIMAKNNQSVPVSDLFGKRGLALLGQVAMPYYHRSQVDTYLRLYHSLKVEVAQLTLQVKQEAKADPMARLLMTIPGVGPITALFLIADIGDIKRFKSYRHLASYFGLVPSLDASADKSRTGHITKQGSSYTRTALVEAAQAATRTKSRLNIYFRRRIVKSGYRKAIVATAHKIVQYAFFILRDQQPYRENPSV